MKNANTYKLSNCLHDLYKHNQQCDKNISHIRACGYFVTVHFVYASEYGQE